MDSRTVPWHAHAVLKGREAQGHCYLDSTQDLISEQAEQVFATMGVTTSLQCIYSDVHPNPAFLLVRFVQMNTPKFPE